MQYKFVHLTLTHVCKGKTCSNLSRVFLGQENCQQRVLAFEATKTILYIFLKVDAKEMLKCDR